MSILIKDMEMPKDECVGIFVYPDGRVHVWRSMSLVGQEYKAISVPPHGRLIDADALKPQFTHGRWDDTYISSLDLSHAPTIIPAEEVYSQYTDTAGNFHWCGTYSGEHTIKAKEGE